MGGWNPRRNLYVCIHKTHTQGTFHPEATRVIVTVDALAEWERGHTSLTGVVPIPRWDLYIIDRWKGSHSIQLPRCRIYTDTVEVSLSVDIPYALLCFM